MEGVQKQDKMFLIVYSGDLDRALSAFSLALTGVSLGMPVTMVFTMWGLNIVRRPDAKPEGSGIRKLMARFNRGGAERLQLSRLNMMGLGTALMNRTMRRSGLPTVAQMIPLAKQMGVKYIACTTPMGLMGLTEKDFVPEVDTFTGAATYLLEAKEAALTYFI